MGMDVVLVAMLLAGPAGSPPPETPLPWGALLGGGLFTVQDTSMLPRGRFLAGVTIDNRDRDPLGLDVVDGAIAWDYGVTPRIEAYGRFIFNRSVAVPDTPVLPPPPLDEILAPGMSPPRRPYYSVYPPIPYVDDTGAEHFGAGTPGDGLVGGKVRILEQSGWRPSVAAQLELQFPIARNLRDLQHGAGTGGFDVRVNGIGQWTRGRWSYVASGAFTRVGTPPYPDRRIEWQGDAVTSTDEPLLLPHRIDIGVGARRVLRHDLAAVGEITTVFDVGRRTKIVDRARPVDVLAGLQFRKKRFRVTAALRDHMHALQSMKIQPSPLAGLVDVTAVNGVDLLQYLTRVGMRDAMPLLRLGTHRLLVPAPDGPPLPPGSRVIPPTYRIRSEHQMGFLVLWGMTF